MLVVFKQELFVLLVQFHNLASKNLVEFLRKTVLFLVIISLDVIEHILWVVYVLLFERSVDLDEDLVDLICFIMAVMIMMSTVPIGVSVSMAS